MKKMHILTPVINDWKTLTEKLEDVTKKYVPIFFGNVFSKNYHEDPKH
jgi:hypothetical protein